MGPFYFTISDDVIQYMCEIFLLFTLFLSFYDIIYLS